ncbi:MAG: hypothetical protein K9L86_06955 [Candidatus Omnitrophica bacterium]|nr:hypothetical protein [Candidatus Omnitrophota bacterium]
MADKKDSLQPSTGSLKPFIIAVIVIAIAWLIGKGVLALIASVKQMQ